MFLNELLDALLALCIVYFPLDLFVYLKMKEVFKKKKILTRVSANITSKIKAPLK